MRSILLACCSIATDFARDRDSAMLTLFRGEFSGKETADKICYGTTTTERTGEDDNSQQTLCILFWRRQSRRQCRTQLVAGRQRGESRRDGRPWASSATRHDDHY